MAEYIYIDAQNVSANQNALLEDSISCPKGYVIHRNGSGILTLRGIVNSPCARFARYQVTANGNIAVPTGGTAGEISIALAIDGEPLQASLAIATPADVEEFFNVTTTAFVTVPVGCCYTVAVENTSADEITIQNLNVVVTRTA